MQRTATVALSIMDLKEEAQQKGKLLISRAEIEGSDSLKFLFRYINLVKNALPYGRKVNIEFIYQEGGAEASMGIGGMQINLYDAFQNLERLSGNLGGDDLEGGRLVVHGQHAPLAQGLHEGVHALDQLVESRAPGEPVRGRGRQLAP